MIRAALETSHLKREILFLTCTQWRMVIIVIWPLFRKMPVNQKTLNRIGIFCYQIWSTWAVNFFFFFGGGGEGRGHRVYCYVLISNPSVIANDYKNVLGFGVYNASILVIFFVSLKTFPQISHSRTTYFKQCCPFAKTHNRRTTRIFQHMRKKKLMLTAWNTFSYFIFNLVPTLKSSHSTSW